VIYDPDLHHRHSQRLEGYDYAQLGAYFVTLCAKDRECLFGEVVDGQMGLNDAGHMATRWWSELNQKFKHVQTDQHVVMPNHFHGILFIVEPMTEGLGTISTRRGRPACLPRDNPRPAGNPQPVGRGCVKADLCGCPDSVLGGHPGPPLPTIVQWYKTMTTNEYLRGVKEFQWLPIGGKLWQRNYYDRIVRDEDELHRIREYIAANPACWAEDEDHPSVSRTPHGITQVW